MKTVISICSSRRHKQEIVAFCARLRELGFIVLEPPLPQWGEEEWETLGERSQFLTLQALTLNHFRRIDRSDAVYFYNPEETLGNGATLELGYAVAKGKLCYAFSDADPELARAVLYDGYVETPEELAQLLLGVHGPDSRRS